MRTFTWTGSSNCETDSEARMQGIWGQYNDINEYRKNNVHRTIDYSVPKKICNYREGYRKTPNETVWSLCNFGTGVMGLKVKNEADEIVLPCVPNDVVMNVILYPSCAWSWCVLWWCVKCNCLVTEALQAHTDQFWNIGHFCYIMFRRNHWIIIVIIIIIWFTSLCEFFWAV